MCIYYTNLHKLYYLIFYSIKIKETIEKHKFFSKTLENENKECLRYINEIKNQEDEEDEENTDLSKYEDVFV